MMGPDNLEDRITHFAAMRIANAIQDEITFMSDYFSINAKATFEYLVVHEDVLRIAQVIRDSRDPIATEFLAFVYTPTKRRDDPDYRRN